jgi:anaerobic selenocysteine-containing dehydrogenase
MRTSRRSLLRTGLAALAGSTVVGCDKYADPYAVPQHKAPVPGGGGKYPGEEHTTKTACAECSLGCGLKVRVLEGRAVKIEGDPDHPIGKGGVCPRGQVAADSLYSASRVTSPMRRKGTRAAPVWEATTWEEAVTTIGRKLTELRSTGIAHRLAVVSGRERGLTPELWARFCQAYGSPNFLETNIEGRSGPLAQAMKLSMGTSERPVWDLAHASYVVSLGAGLFEGSSMVSFARDRASARDPSQRQRLVQIDSSYTLTASKADQWVPVKPGTLDTFAMSVASVLVKEGLYDKEFVSAHGYGFEAWKEADGTAHAGLTEALEKWDPEKAGPLCGVKPEMIVRIARDAAAHRPALFVVDDRSLEASNALSVARAALTVNALLGSIDKLGGVLTQRRAPLTDWAAPTLDAIATAPHDRFDDAARGRSPLAESVPDAWVDVARSSSPGTVAALFIDGYNPAYQVVESSRFGQAVEKVPLVVSFSTTMDDTSRLADWILPDLHFLERFDDLSPAPVTGFPVFGLRQPVVKPVHEGRATGDVIIQLAKAVGGSVAASFPWKDFKSAVLERMPGLNVEGTTPHDPTPDGFTKKLTSSGVWSGAAYQYGQWAEVLRTPSSRFEFFSQAGLSRLKAAPKGSAALPAEQVDALCLGLPEEANWQGDAAQFPFFFVPYTGVTGLTSTHLQEIGDPLTGARWSVAAEIHPKTAHTAGVHDGEHIIVRSPSGTLSARARLVEGVAPGLVRMATGHGHVTESGASAGPASIIPAGAPTRLGVPALWSARVRVERVAS